VVSTGGTLLGLLDLVEAAARSQGFPPPPVLGVYCAAQEGDRHPLIPVPVRALATLPRPVPEDAA
jgi:adenine phosphoribosyltransferase